MSYNKLLILAVMNLLVIGVSGGLSGCNENVAVQEWIGRVDPLRAKTVESVNSFPYHLEQHQAFKNYFSEIEQIALKLTQDKTYVTNFNNALAKTNFQDACARVFIPLQDWQTIMGHCLKNGLFICSEEVRVYPELVSAIRGLLVPEQQKRFDSTPSCQRALNSR
ncbi:hypothetical protein WDW86_07375 [Bdellovibrionota bacterium FG-2]